MSTAQPRLVDRLPDRRALLIWTLVLNVELLALLAYAVLADVTYTDPRYALYGLVWLNVGGWILLRTDVSPTSDRTRRRAIAVTVAYFALLAWAGGLVGPGVAAARASGISVVWLPPGWGPALVYRGDLLSIILMPAKVVGYLGLAYLVYATVIDVPRVSLGSSETESRTPAGAAVSGILGLLSCVSCTWPVIASVATTVLGSTSALAAATMTYTYDLSTAVFLVTVALLAWRPMVR